MFGNAHDNVKQAFSEFGYALVVYPVALRAVLSRQIEAVLTSSEARSHLPTAEPWATELALLPTDRGLKRVRGVDAVLYQWAIAPRLSGPLALSPAAIAHTLVHLLSQSIALTRQLRQAGAMPFEDLWADCEVRVWPPHLVQIAVGDRALASWLEQAIGRPVTQSLPRPSHPWVELADQSKDIFLLQVAHARCCSLLRLGERQGLICLASASASEFPSTILVPRPLPWLAADGRLGLSHPAERQLLSQVLHSWDGMERCRDRPTSTLWAHAAALHQSFYGFEAACRLLGPVNALDPAPAQARLGLIFLTRHGLGRLLSQFGVFAPLEL